jgi:hypothetical protein
MTRWGSRHLPSARASTGRRDNLNAEGHRERRHNCANVQDAIVRLCSEALAGRSETRDECLLTTRTFR